MQERLQKYLARAGIASRRKAEEMIAAGLVKVNGEQASLGTVIDATRDVVTLEGQVVTQQQKKVYYILNKPLGVVTTARDTHGRPTVLSLLPQETRLFPVGRLDMDTEGLLLLTNDGDFAYALTHPKFKVPKRYLVEVKGRPRESELARLRQGIDLEGRKTAPAEVKAVRLGQKNSVLEVVLYEGRKRQVRRMCAAVGYPVLELKRTAFGTLELDNLPVGQARELTPTEVKSLLSAAGYGKEARGEKGKDGFLSKKHDGRVGYKRPE